MTSQAVNSSICFATRTLVVLMIAAFGVSWTCSSAVEAFFSLQGAPHLTINATSSTGFESLSGEAVFVVTRDGSTAQPLTVRLNIGGSATNGVDYATMPNQIQIPAGSVSTEIRIRPIDDSQVEADEKVTIGLADVPINSTFDHTLASITIKDNDTVVEVLALNANGAESGSQPIVFRFTRTGDVRSQLTVNYLVNSARSLGSPNTGGMPVSLGDGSVRTTTITDGTSNTITVGESSNLTMATSGVDFSQLPGTITFQPGESSKQVSVNPVDDSEPEAKESVTIAIARSQLYTVGANISATGFIEDNDQSLPILSLTATQAAAYEAGPTSGIVTVTRDIATAQSLTVLYSVNSGTVTNPATNGIDFDRLSGKAVIPAGATSVTITVKPIEDKEVEPEERVVLELATAGPATYVFKIGANQATVVIKDRP